MWLHVVAYGPQFSYSLLGSMFAVWGAHSNGISKLFVSSACTNRHDGETTMKCTTINAEHPSWICTAFSSESDNKSLCKRINQ